MNFKVLLICLTLLITTSKFFSQGSTCAQATPFCTAVGTPFSYQNVSDNTGVGCLSCPSAGCLVHTPRPSWFYIKSSAAGVMTFSLTQSTVAPGGAPDIDVDFISYGPYNAAAFATACTSGLTGTCTANHVCSGNVQDCSYSAAATETMTITATAPGQYFLIMITNYNGTSGWITFTQTGGPATDCSITCPSVISGDGFTLSSGQPLPSILSCDASAITIVASDNSPFGAPVVPGVMFNLETTANATYSIDVYSASSGYLTSLGPLGANTNVDYQLYFMSPSETYSFSLCETNSASANVPYSIMDLASGTTFTYGTWVDDGLCQTVVMPPGTMKGVSTFTSSCGACVVTSPNGNGYGSFNPSIAGVGTHTITYTFAPGAPCAPYVFSKVITVVTPTVTSGMTNTTICEGASATLTVSSGPTQTFSNTSSFAIPDGSATGVSSPITVSGIPGNAGSSLVSINVNITHTWDSDLDLFLVSPCGYTIALSQANGGSLDNYTSTTFSTSGTSIYAGTPPFTGTFRPEDPLFALSGCASNGVWKLFVRDNTSGDVGTITSWSIFFTDKNTYNWTPNTNLSATTGTNVVASPTTTTVYSVTASTNAGCLSPAKTITVTVNPKPTANAGSTNTLTCSNTTLNLSGSGGGNYSWTGPGITAGGTTSAPTVNAPGNYSLVVTSAAGCPSSVSTVSISQNITPPTPTASNSTTLTCTTTTAALTGGGGGTYVWSGPGITAGGTTSTPTVNAPGNYSVTVTAANGCTAAATTSLTQNITPPTPSASNSTTLTCTTTTAALTGGGGGTYVWSGPGITAGGTTSTPTVNAPGNYSVTVTAANGCTAAATTSLTQNITPPTPSASNSTTLTCTTTTAALTGGGGGTYVWSGPGITAGGTTSTPTVNAPGNYSVTVTAANGCTAVATTSLTQNITPPTPSASNSTTLTCTTTTAALTGGGGGTYVWSGPGITAGGTTSSPTVNAPGSYTVKVTAANGCTAVATTSVSQTITPPTPSASNSTTLTCTTTTAALTGGGGGTYVWSGPGITAGGTTSSPTVNAPGSYTVKVTAANGCTAVATTSVSQTITPPTPSASNSTTLTCTTTTAALTGGGGGTYVWSGPGITAGGTTSTPTVNAPGNYSVTVTAANGCTAAATTSLTQNITPPTPSASNSTTLTCTTTTAALTGGGGGTYVWSGPGITAGGTTSTPTVNAPGNYSVTVTAANGCTAAATTSLTQNITPPTPSASNSTTLTCTTTTAALTGGGGGTYVWSGPGITAGGTTSTPTVNAPGNYSVTVTAANGCTAAATTSLTQNITPPTPSASNSTTLTCTTTTAALTGGGGGTYVWSGPGITAGGTTSSPTVNAPGSYTVKVTAANGCTAVATTSVSQTITPPTPSASNSTTLTCTTTTAALTGGGGGTYVWSGPGITAGGTTSSPTVNAPGNYSVTVTAANGCTAVATTSLTQNITPPTPSASNSTTLTCTTTTAALTGGGGGTYVWSGPGITAGGTTSTPTVNAPGNYSVTVTAANGCTAAATTSLTQNITPPTPSASNSTTLTCTTTTAALTGGGGGTYVWSGPGITAGGTTSTPTVNAPGNYSVTVTAANGCTAAATTSLTQNITIPSVTMPSNQIITCASPTVSLIGSANPTTCTPVWTGGVSSGATSFTATAASANVYTLTVTNPANGCFTAGSVTVTPSAGFPSLSPASVSNSITCTTTTAQAVVTSTTSNVTYSWTGPGITSGASTPTINVNVSGTYSLAVTNTISMCTTSTTAFVPLNNTPPGVSINAPSVITCSTTSISLTANPSSGSYTYTWTADPGLSGTSVPTPTITLGGTYSVAITNTVNGCIGSASVVVTTNTIAPTVNIASPSVTTTCANPTITIVATSTPSTGVTYSWISPGTGSLNNSTISNPVASGSGIFTVVVTNTASGCSSSATQNTVQVTPDLAIPTVTLSVNSLSITCSSPTVTSSASTLSSPVSYSWSPTAGIVAGSETTANPVFNAAGSYSVVVTNTTSGCASSISSNVVNVVLDNTIPTISLSSGVNDGTITCTNTLVTISPTVTPNANLTYTWSPSGVSSSTLSSATFTAAGVYTLAVTNTLTGCVTSSTNTANSFTVIANNTPPTFTLGTAPTVTATCAVPSVTLSGASNADPNSIYTWLTPVSTTVTGNPITVSNPGIYTVAVTNTINGCSSSSVSQNTVEVVADAGIPTVTLSANTVSITCSNLTPSVSISTTATPVSYNWTPTAGIVPGTETTANPVFNAVGSYSAVVTNTSSGCATGIASNVVDVVLNNTTPTVSLTSAGGNTGTLTCITTSIVVTPTVIPANATYTWSSSTGTFTNTIDATFTSPDSYTLTVTDAVTGCTTSATNPANVFTVYQNTVVPTMTLTSAGGNTGTLTCITTSIIVTPTVVPANATYTWSSSTGTFTNTIDATFTSPDSYTLTVTDAVTGCTTSTTNPANVFTVYQNTVVPTMTLTSVGGNTGTLTCITTSIIVTPTVVPANSTYTWTSSTGTFTNTIDATFTSPDSYTLTVTDAVTGCTTSATNPANVFTVYQNTVVPTMTLTSASGNSDTLTCSKTSVVVTPTVVPANSTYTWTSSTGTFTNTIDATFTSPDSYTLTVTDAVTGCTTSATNPANVFTVYQNTVVPTMTLTSASGNSDTLTCSKTSVVVTPTVIPANATYTWTSSTGMFTNTIGAIFTSPDSYTLTVTDVITGCVSSATNTADVFTVYQNTVAPTATISAVSTNSTIGCVGSNTIVTLGSATSSSTYTTIWSPGGISTPTLDVTSPGIYSLLVTDAVTGCTVTVPYTVTGSTIAPQGVNAGPAANIACGSASTALTGTTSSTGVNYSWAGPSATSIIPGTENTANPIVTEVGDYTLTVTDNTTGCFSTANVSVTQAIATASITANPTSGISPLDVAFTGAGAGLPIYSWSFGDGNTSNNQNPNNTFTTGTYTVTLTTISGTCTATATVEIVVEDGFTIEIPNVFTPNNDNANDVFTIKSTGVKEISLQIFNRWGEKLYEFTGAKASWDGLAPNGSKVPEGTYFYFVKATGFDGTEYEKHGTMNLFR